MYIFMLCIVGISVLGVLCLIAHWTRKLLRIHKAIMSANRHTICPACHRFVRLRYFQCDKCGTVHDLTPTEHEAGHKMCSCGRNLSKLPGKGRNELVAVCTYSDCRYLLGRNAGKDSETVIPIIGGPSTGKSAYLAAWTFYAQTQLPQEHKAVAKFPFPGGKEFAKRCMTLFSTGTEPQKTSNRTPNALGMDIAFKNKQYNTRLYLYDPAGEVFDYNPNSLQDFHYYDYMDGVIFLIDPFSIPVLRAKYADALRVAEIESHFQVFAERTVDYSEKFIRAMYLHHLAPDEYHYASCAVVITKADAFDMDSFIGNQAVRRRITEDPRISYEDALSDVCFEQLHHWGMGHVLKQLQWHFKEVRCFSVSAFGHMPKPGIPFTPKRIEMPILWLMQQRQRRAKLYRP
jgi:hypothetical protein